jgi:transcription elongation factor GreB
VHPQPRGHQSKWVGYVLAMSKAFTRESDAEESEVLPSRAPLPPGVKNYITAHGAEKLQTELRVLVASGGSSAGREARIRQLREIIPTLVIAEPPADREQARFGASVKIQRGNEIEIYRLVGVDEIDLDRNEISWLSPLGKVLLGKRAGDVVRFRAPEGNVDLKIISVAYD